MKNTQERTVDPTSGGRAAGAWTAIAALLLLVSLAMHPPPSAETAAFMDMIAEEGTTWRVVHWLVATALASFVVAGLVALSVPDLSRSALTKSAWGVLTLGALLTLITAVAEATVIADLAAEGDLVAFSAWQALAEGTALGFAALAIAAAALGFSEARNQEAALPRWAAYSVVPLGVAAVGGWIAGPVLGFAFGGPLWLVSSLAMSLWLVAYGIGIVRVTARVAHMEVSHA